MRHALFSAALLGCLLVVLPAGAAEQKLADLIEGLKSPDLSARVKAIDELGDLGEKAEEAVPSLTGLLKDDSPLVRAHAAETLGEIGAPAKKLAVPRLVALVGDPDPAVRRKAIEAVRRLRPGPRVVLPLLVKVLQDADPAVRNRALNALADVGEEAVPALIAALKDPQASYWACLVVREIGPPAKDAVPALTDLLDDSRPEVRHQAILALGAVGEAAAPAVPKLAKALDDDLLRVAATFALAEIGHVPPEAEAKIRQNVNSSDKLCREVSIWALAKLHPDDKQLLREATDILVDGLKSDDPRVRQAAARALGALRPGPEIAVPALEKGLQGANEQVLVGALDALAALGPPAVPRLIDALKFERARAQVAYILGRMGPSAKPAVGALTGLIDDKDPEVQKEAAMALGRIGPDAKDAVPALVKALPEREGAVAYAIVYALGMIGPGALEAEPALLKTVDSSDESLSLFSAWALTQIHPDCPKCAGKVVPVLVRGLADPEAKFRLGAVHALGALGPLARPALPALKKSLQDEDAAVREAAAKAIEAIGS